MEYMRERHSLKPGWIALLIPIIIVLSVSACKKEVAEEQSTASAQEPERVSVEQVKQWMDRGESIVFLDSRKGSAWGSAKTMLPDAVRVPPNEIEENVSEVPKEGIVVAYCT